MLIGKGDYWNRVTFSHIKDNMDAKDIMIEGDLKVKITDEVAQGKYSNLAVVAHSTSEFVLDFAKLLPGFNGGLVHSRVIMAPEHCKRLLFALKDNIDLYESQYGTIQIPEHTIKPPFGTPKGEA